MQQTENAVSVIERENSPAWVVWKFVTAVLRAFLKKQPIPHPIWLMPACIYFPRFFDAIEKTEKSSRGEYEITDSIRIMIEGGQKVACHVIDQCWI
jgi:bifunctional UDP-N-acetylglucosamine pyrophosphorylase/glucosamine-1-phosphate N-acetyltransferase